MVIERSRSCNSFYTRRRFVESDDFIQIPVSGIAGRGTGLMCQIVMGIKQSTFAVMGRKNAVAVDAGQYQPCPFHAAACRHICILLIDVDSLRPAEIISDIQFVALHTSDVDIHFENTAAAGKIRRCQRTVAVLVGPQIDDAVIDIHISCLGAARHIPDSAVADIKIYFTVTGDITGRSQIGSIRVHIHIYGAAVITAYIAHDLHFAAAARIYVDLAVRATGK